MAQSSQFVTANSPHIQYFGRWDMRDSLRPRYSWPEVYLSAEFTGTSIGVRLRDHTNYFNVYIDDKLHSVFHGTGPGEPDYILADTLENTRHRFRFSRRNITFGEVYTFSGILLDSGIRKNVQQVVNEEKRNGKRGIFCTTFDEFPGGYVANGHPAVDTHRKMADQIIAAMESFSLFSHKDEKTVLTKIWNCLISTHHQEKR